MGEFIPSVSFPPALPSTAGRSGPVSRAVAGHHWNGISYGFNCRQPLSKRVSFRAFGFCNTAQCFKIKTFSYAVFYYPVLYIISFIWPSSSLVSLLLTGKQTETQVCRRFLFPSHRWPSSAPRAWGFCSRSTACSSPTRYCRHAS